MSKLCTLKANAPDRLHQHIGEGGEQQTQIIGPPVMRAGVIGRQPQLLLLDVAFHLAMGAVEAIVEVAAVAREAGDV